MSDGRTRLAPAERGGIIIVTLFAASFIFGVIVAVHGIGHAIHAGDAKRDAADSTAFSAAALYANAMNQVALLNMAKVTTLAILSAHTGIEAGVIAGGLYAGGMGFATLDPAYWVDVGKLVAMGIVIGIWLATNIAKLTQLLKALDQAQEALRTEIPTIVSQRLRLVSLAFPDVRRVFVAPATRPLPLQKAPIDVPCGRIVPLVAIQLVAAFKDMTMKDVGVAAGLAAGLAAEAACLLYVATGGSTKEISALLGKEEYQLRGYAVGAALRTGEESGVRIATWRRDEEGGQVARLRDSLSQIGLAQAEFYFDGSGPQRGLASELLFATKWRARLRRYRDVDNFGQFRQGCTRNGGGLACARAATALQQAKELIVH